MQGRFRDLLAFRQEIWAKDEIEQENIRSFLHRRKKLVTAVECLAKLAGVTLPVKIGKP